MVLDPYQDVEAQVDYFPMLTAICRFVVYASQIPSLHGHRLDAHVKKKHAEGECLFYCFSKLSKTGRIIQTICQAADYTAALGAALMTLAEDPKWLHPSTLGG